MYSHIEGSININKLKSFISSSKYVCGNIITSFNLIDKYIPEDAKLIVPTHCKLLSYNNEGPKFEIDNIESFQCQISGKCKINESFVSAAQREVFEEIGTFLDKSDIKEIHREVHSYKYGKNNEDINNTVVYYLVNMDSVKPKQDNILKLEIETTSLLQDDYNRRVVIFMYTKDLNLCEDIITNRYRIKQYGIEEESFTGLCIFFPTKNIILNSLIKVQDYWEYRKIIYNKRFRF